MKRIIEKLFNFLATIWREGKKFTDAHIQPSVDFVNKLKAIVNSTAADFVTTVIIPGEWDDKALAWLRAALPKATGILGIVADCGNIEDPVAYITCITDKIKAYPEGARAGLYRDLAAQLALAKAEYEKYEHGLTLANVNLAIEADYNKRFAHAV